MRVHFHRCAVAAALLLTAGCGGGASAPGSETGTIAGLVEVRACGGPPPPSAATPSCSFQPAGGARIDLSANDRTVAQATTGSDGHYSLQAPAGSYRLEVAIHGGTAPLTDSRTVRVEPGRQVQADFDLTFQAA